jgi:hypothetical protein
MPLSETPAEDGQLFTHVDDEQYDELSELDGQPIVHVAVWEDGLADAISFSDRDGTAAKTKDAEVAADIDLYLRDGVYFELYGTLCYADLDAPPLADLNQIEQSLQRLVKAGVVLEEIAVDEDEGLVLILAQRHRPVMYLRVGAWLLDEWEELPEAPPS